jgi:hypothetical protein
MTTSQKNAYLHEILGNDPIPIGKLAFFRERFRDKLYDLVLSEFLKEEKVGLTKAAIARRIGRKPEQITRWLGAPGNWTVETVSDLLLAISRAEPNVSIAKLSELQSRNYQYQDDWPQKEMERASSPQPSAQHPSLGERNVDRNSKLGVKALEYEDT